MACHRLSDVDSPHCIVRGSACALQAQASRGVSRHRRGSWCLVCLACLRDASPATKDGYKMAPVLRIITSVVLWCFCAIGFATRRHESLKKNRKCFGDLPRIVLEFSGSKKLQNIETRFRLEICRPRTLMSQRVSTPCSLSFWSLRAVIKSYRMCQSRGQSFRCFDVFMSVRSKVMSQRVSAPWLIILEKSLSLGHRQVCIILHSLKASCFPTWQASTSTCNPVPCRLTKPRPSRKF